MDKHKSCPHCGGEITERNNQGIKAYCCQNPNCGAITTFTGFVDGKEINSDAAWEKRVEDTSRLHAAEAIIRELVLKLAREKGINCWDMLGCKIQSDSMLGVRCRGDCIARLTSEVLRKL